eukprot:305878_1
MSIRTAEISSVESPSEDYGSNFEVVIFPPPQIDCFRCDYCDKEFLLNQHLIQHVGECHKNKSKPCETGQMQFDSSTIQPVNSYKQSSTSILKNEINEKQASSSMPSLECDICHKFWMSQSELKTHMKTHSDVRLHSCEFCQKTFKQRATLTKHLRTHNGMKPFTCDICQKVFSQRSALKAHIIIHSDARPYSCDICEKSFKRKCDLRCHVMDHTGEKSFRCDICQKQFKKRFCLTQHLRTHNVVKPYSCDICQKGFSQRGGLKSHMRIHSDTR